MVEFNVTAWLRQIWLWLMGDKVKSIFAKQVIQEELGLDIPIAGLQKNDKHQTHELLFGDPLEVVELSS